jgi:hypothetical protein
MARGQGKKSSGKSSKDIAQEAGGPVSEGGETHVETEQEQTGDVPPERDSEA